MPLLREELPKSDLLIKTVTPSPNGFGQGDEKVDDNEVARSYAPFISKGSVSLVG